MHDGTAYRMAVPFEFAMSKSVGRTAIGCTNLYRMAESALIAPPRPSSCRTASRVNANFLPKFLSILLSGAECYILAKFAKFLQVI